MTMFIRWELYGSTLWKVLDLEGGSTRDCAKTIQYTKKSEDDPNVDSQLWFFDGGFIINKKSGLVLDVCEGNIKNATQIIQYNKGSPEPINNQEWDYNYEDNTIRLRSNRKFVLDVWCKGQDDATIIVLGNVDELVINIMDKYKFLPNLSQDLLGILDDDEYYNVTIEVGNDPNVKIFRAHKVILNYRSPYFRKILSANKEKNNGTLVHIKLPNILPETFEMILGYIYVLPKELYVELLREFLDNTKTSSKAIPRMSKLKNFDSEIITLRHVKTISKWIKRLEITDELATSIEFKLLFRGSHDGFYPAKFHEICDNQSHTVIIVKVEGNNEILGGYNPIAWKSDNIYDKKHATDNRCYCGPSFGDGDLIIWGFDLQKLRNYCRSSKKSYEKPIRETEDVFFIEEYEVFRLIFKS
ncbi:carbohydrate-binding module family 13 protein [Rhizophagus clarus]|uniref:Carbohydrate-binding module family 13 protein n=1 Tax=Rhizophagus clarus TaxID=94130 RepID=A0A8H3L5H0_9GLOM|nr:carbohydrate-binding module family 13 protein [Rhizophagus clarus]